MLLLSIHLEDGAAMILRELLLEIGTDISLRDEVRFHLFSPSQRALNRIIQWLSCCFHRPVRHLQISGNETDRNKDNHTQGKQLDESTVLTNHASISTWTESATCSRISRHRRCCRLLDLADESLTGVATPVPLPVCPSVQPLKLLRAWTFDRKKLCS